MYVQIMNPLAQTFHRVVVKQYCQEICPNLYDINSLGPVQKQLFLCEKIVAVLLRPVVVVQLELR